ncbi:MAG: cellulase family glycosylhydrolase [Pseudomonadota bacterium]
MDLWVTWPGPEKWGDPQTYAQFPEWMKFVSDDELRSLRQSGFDTIRLPIEPAFLLYNDDPERRGIVTAGIKIAIDRLIAEGFKVIVDFHTIDRDHPKILGTEQIIETPSIFDDYLDTLAFVAGQLDRYDPALLAIEVLNEPMLDCHDRREQNQWQTMSKRLYDAVLGQSPTRAVILSGGCWGSAEALALMDPEGFGENVIWSFHTYEPFAITHQGARWTGDMTAHLRDIPYPPFRDDARPLTETIQANVAAIRQGADKSNRDNAIDMLAGNLNDASSPEKLDASLRQSFEIAARWADAHNISRSQIFVGEFGMIGREYGTDVDVPDAWRVAYMRDMITLADEYEFAWSVWSFGGAFGLMQAYGGEQLANPLADDLLLAPTN